MATISETLTVRVERPPEVSLEEFFGGMRTWLDHHRIMLADFRSVILAEKSGVFDAQFNNLQHARLFEGHFAAQPTSDVPARLDLPWSAIATPAAVSQSQVSAFAAMTDVIPTAGAVRLSASR
jgi:hypothetical protein